MVIQVVVHEILSKIKEPLPLNLYTIYLLDEPARYTTWYVKLQQSFLSNTYSYKVGKLALLWKKVELQLQLTILVQSEFQANVNSKSHLSALQKLTIQNKDIHKLNKPFNRPFILISINK